MADANDDLRNSDKNVSEPVSSQMPFLSETGAALDSDFIDQSGSAGQPEIMGTADKLEELFHKSDKVNAAGGSASDTLAQKTEQLLNQAEVDLVAAIAPELNSQSGVAADLNNATPYEFQVFEAELPDTPNSVGLKVLDDVELDVCIELGRTKLVIEEVLKLKNGSVIPLDKLAGDPVDILVNSRLIARGEIVVLNENFCVRVAEIISPDDL